MGKLFQGRTLFALLPVAAIFIISAILLNSCGQGNPAGSQTGTTSASKPGISNTPASTIPLSLSNPPSNVELFNASDAATIKWNSYPGATTYNLYYSNTPDFANSSKISGITSPYIFPFADRRKSYFFFLTAGNGSAEQRISGDFISLYKNGGHYSVVIPFDSIYKLFKEKRAASLSFPFMEKAYADNLSWPSIIHSDGPITAYLNVAPPITFLGLSLQCLHKEPDGSYTMDYLQGSNLWGSYTSKYLATIINANGGQVWVGYAYLGESTLGKFTNINNTSLTFKIDKPITGSYRFWGGGSFMLDWMTGQQIYPPGYLEINTGKDILRVNNTQNGFGVYIDFDLVASNAAFTVTPASATAYLHPTPTPVQFTAKDGNNADVTNTAQWKIEPTATTPPVTIANINAGYATPLKPGEASVTASLLDGSGNVTASGQAILDVMCRAYQYWPQDGMPYSIQFLGYTTIGGTIGRKGCALTDTSMLMSGANFIYDPGQLNTAYKGVPIKKWYSKKDGKWHTDSIGFIDGNLKFDAVGKTSISSGNIQFQGATNDPASYTQPLNITDLDTYLDKCYAVIIGIRTSIIDPTHHHYVLVIGREGNKHLINDPGWGKKYLEDFNNSNIYSMYFYTFTN